MTQDHRSSVKNERITEIGAVKIKNGEIADSFSTYVNPLRPISKKSTELTGITDEIVKYAPTEKQALEMFYSFCGDCDVLVAHNAAFDTSFIRAAAARSGLPYEFTSVDTVPLCRIFYPDLKNYKLDTVASHIGIEDFKHHRALDDAKALAAIFTRLIGELKKRGIISIGSINTELAGIDTRKIRPFHAIIFAKDKKGLKNLYKLISWSHLHNFHRKPRITKSKLLEHREGLIIGSGCEQGELYQAVVNGKTWDELCEIIGFTIFLKSAGCQQSFPVAQRMARMNNNCANSTVQSSASAKCWTYRSAPPVIRILLTLRMKSTAKSCFPDRDLKTPIAAFLCISAPPRKCLRNSAIWAKKRLLKL